MSKFNPCPKEGPKPKKEPKPIKRTRIKYKKKDTGQVDTFTEIAEEREWYDWITGEKLWKLEAINFAHVLPKALNKFPLYKCYSPNIILVTAETHRKIDFWPESDLRKDPAFDKFFKLRDPVKNNFTQFRYFNKFH